MAMRGGQEEFPHCTLVVAQVRQEGRRAQADRGARFCSRHHRIMSNKQAGARSQLS